jgi:hypothetical protein
LAAAKEARSVAELCANGGRIEEGRAALEQGRTMSEKIEDRFSLPEFDRIEGELLLVRSARNQADAQACSSDPCN